MKLEHIAKELEQSPEDTENTLDELVEKGYVRQIKVKEEVWYKAHFGRKADKVLSSGIWSSLDNVVEEEDQK